MADYKKVGGVGIEMVLDMKKLKKGVVEFKSGFKDINSSLTKADKKLIKTKLEADKAGEEFKKMGNKAKEGGAKVNSSFSRISTGVRASTATVLAFGAAYAGSLTAMLGVSDRYISIQNQLRQRTDGSAEAVQKLSDEIFAMANDSRVPVEDMAKAFQRFDTAIVDSGGNTKESKIVIDSVAKSLSLMGASAGETGSVMTQLSQAFASGVLRGDEFNSINEAAPSIMKAIAKEMGVTQGALRSYAEEGAITADIIKSALINSNEAIRENFNNSTQTFGQSMTVLKNDLTQAFGELDQKIGGNQKIQLFIETIRKNIPNMIVAIEKAIDVMGFFAGIIAKVSSVTVEFGKYLTSGWVGKFTKLILGAITVIYLAQKAMGAWKIATIALQAVMSGGMIKSIGQFVIGTTASTAAMGGATIASRVLAIAMRGLLIASGVGIVLVALGFIAEKLIGQMGGASSSAQELFTRLDKLNTELSITFGSQFEEETKKLEDSMGKIKRSLEEGDTQKFISNIGEAKDSLIELGEQAGLSADYIQNRWGELAKEDLTDGVLDGTEMLENIEVLKKEILEAGEDINKSAEIIRDSFVKLTSGQDAISFDEAMTKIQEYNQFTDDEFTKALERLSYQAGESGNLAEQINYAIAAGMTTEEGLQMIEDAGGVIGKAEYDALVPKMRLAIQQNNKEASKVSDAASILDGSKGSFKAAGNNIIANLVNGLNEQQPKIVSTLSNIGSIINDFIKQVSGIDIGKLFSRFSTAAKGIAKSLPTTGVFGALTKTLSASADGLVSAVDKAIGKAKSANSTVKEIVVTDTGIVTTTEEDLEGNKKTGGGGGGGGGGGASRAKVSDAEKAAKKEREDIIKDLEKKEAEAEKNVGKVKLKWTEKKNKANTKYRADIKKTEEQIEELGEKHTEYAKGVIEDLDDVRFEISEFIADHKELTKELKKDFENDVAQRYIDAQEELEALKKGEEEFKKQREEYQQSVTDGTAEYDYEKFLEFDEKIKKSLEDQKTLQEEIALAKTTVGQENIDEAQRFDGLSETEKKIEGYAKEKEEAQKAFEAEKAILEEKESIMQAYLDGQLESLGVIEDRENQKLLKTLQTEQEVYQKKLDSFTSTLEEMDRDHEAKMESYSAREETAINNSIARWNRLKAAREAAQGVSGVSTDTPSDIPAFAKGTRYVQGEGTGTSDSILARLSKGERVIDAARNKLHAPLYDAIENLSSASRSTVNRISEDKSVNNKYENHFHDTGQLNPQQLVQMQRFYN